MDEFSLTVDYFANENIRRRVVPDSPTKFHTVPSIIISKLQNCHQIEQPSLPSSSSSGNSRERSDSESSDESMGEVDAFQYFIEHNDETFLLNEIEDEDDDDSPLLNQIVPTDETVKEEQELKELEDRINSEESLPSALSCSLPSSLASPSSSNSTSTSDSSTNTPSTSTTTTVSSTRKRPHSSIESTPIPVSKKPKLVVVSHQKTETQPGSQSTSQAMTSLSSSSSSSTSQGGQAFKDIYNSLQNQVQRTTMTSTPPRKVKPVFIKVTRITVILPIKSISSLKTLEKRVAEDVRVKQALHERLSRVSGTNALDCIERILNTFVTPQVRRKMDWMEVPGKFCFGSTILQPITFDSVRFHFPQATDSQLEQFTRNWFMQGNSISM